MSKFLGSDLQYDPEYYDQFSLDALERLEQDQIDEFELREALDISDRAVGEFQSPQH
jgi:hypothetical protein